jgi:predicted DNA-binding protein (MmcQ/YjbR family)
MACYLKTVTGPPFNFFNVFNLSKIQFMDSETFRHHCLSLKQANEKIPFDKAKAEYDKNLLVFSVLDKWFCFYNIDAFDFCDIKCSPEESKQLQSQYEGVKPGYHMNKKHWISVYFNQDVPDTKILELVTNSYDLVVGSLTKKQREELQNMV